MTQPTCETCESWRGYRLFPRAKFEMCQNKDRPHGPYGAGKITAAGFSCGLHSDHQPAQPKEPEEK